MPRIQRALPRAAGAHGIQHFRPALLAVGRVVHARRRARRRDPVLPGASAAGRGSSSRRCSRSRAGRRSGACASCATRPGTRIDNAYRLRRRHRRQQLFGLSSKPYPEYYTPRPYSRSYVQHLEPWYAQSHPDEDFAETFAVWLTPDSPWRTRYQDWPALKKLEYVDALMREIGSADPARSPRAARSTRCRGCARRCASTTRRSASATASTTRTSTTATCAASSPTRPSTAANPSAARSSSAASARDVRVRVAPLDRRVPVHHRPGDRRDRQALPRAQPAPGVGAEEQRRSSISPSSRRADHALPAQRPAPGVADEDAAHPRADARGPGAARGRRAGDDTPRPTGRWSSTSPSRCAEARPRGAQRSASAATSASSARPSTSGSRTSCSTCWSTSTAFRSSTQNVVSYLELLRIPYTGCNPRGLMLARDKGLSKKLLAYHRIPVPEFAVYPDRPRAVRRPKRLHFPLIVKSLTREASTGISQASVVEDDAQARRARALHPRDARHRRHRRALHRRPRALRRRARQPAPAGVPGVGAAVHQDAATSCGTSPPTG